jgi:hypothetical protein
MVGHSYELVCPFVWMLFRFSQPCRGTFIIFFVRGAVYIINICPQTSFADHILNCTSFIAVWPGLLLRGHEIPPFSFVDIIKIVFMMGIDCALCCIDLFYRGKQNRKEAEGLEGI